MPAQVNTTQRACVPIASLPACASRPGNSPVYEKEPKNPPSKFSFSEGAIVSDAVASC